MASLVSQGKMPRSGYLTGSRGLRDNDNSDLLPAHPTKQHEEQSVTYTTIIKTLNGKET